MSKTLLEMAPTQPSESGCYQNIQHNHNNKSSMIARYCKICDLCMIRKKECKEEKNIFQATFFPSSHGCWRGRVGPLFYLISRNILLIFLKTQINVPRHRVVSEVGKF